MATIMTTVLKSSNVINLFNLRPILILLASQCMFCQYLTYVYRISVCLFFPLRRLNVPKKILQYFMQREETRADRVAYLVFEIFEKLRFILKEGTLY